MPLYFSPPFHFRFHYSPPFFFAAVYFAAACLLAIFAAFSSLILRHDIAADGCHEDARFRFR
jgi:hypothetical protein